MKKFFFALTLIVALILCFSSLSMAASAREVEFQNPTEGVPRTAYLSPRRYLGVLIDVEFKEDNTITYRDVSSDWTNTDTAYLCQWTNAGNRITFSFFVGYRDAVTANELVIGDITHWIYDTPKDDLDTIAIYSATDPNGVWTKVPTTNVRYDCDEELSGTYNFGGLRFLFEEEVTANYFLLVDEDPNGRRLFLAGNMMCAVYNEYPEGFDPAETTKSEETAADETTDEAIAGDETTAAEETTFQPVEFQDPEEGISRVVHISARRYLGVLADVQFKQDNTIIYRDVGVNWTNTDPAYLYQWTVPGNGVRYSYFVGYMKPVTANEIVVGDITHWIYNTAKDDLDTLTVYAATDPDGVWTKVETTNVRYNCDTELSGTYKFGGIRFLFKEEVTANYFMVVDTDPIPRRFYMSGNVMAAVYNKYPETSDVVETTTAVETEEIVETTADVTTEVDETTEVGASEKDGNDAALYAVIAVAAAAVIVVVIVAVSKKKKK